MGGRALLVEESETIANNLVPLLHKVGIEVEWVADAASAVGRLDIPAGLDAVIVESAVAADRGLDLVERTRAAGLRAVLLLGDGESAPAGAQDVAIKFPVNAASLYAALGSVADAAPDPTKILTPPATEEEVMPPPTWSIPEASAPSSQPAPVSVDETDPALVKAAADRVEKGRTALKEGRLELAIIELESAAALHPQSSIARGLSAWARILRVREVAKNLGTAQQNLVAAAEAGNDAELWTLAAEVALDLGLQALAQQRAKKALLLSPNLARAKEIADSAAKAGRTT